MRRLPYLLLFPVTACVTACAGNDGAWPSLARRPIEGPVPVATGRCAAAQPSCVPPGTVETALPAPAPTSVAPAPPVAIDDIAARLAVIDRDLADAAARLAAQRTAATAAQAKARAAKSDTDALAKAEIERTALDRVGNQIGDIRDRLDAIAGTLAAASAGGGDVTVPFATTGRLIARATAMQADYSTAAAALH